MSTKQKTKKKKKQKKEAKERFSVRLKKSGSQTVEAVRKFIPTLDKTGVFEWALSLLRAEMLRSDIPPEIRLKILRAKITALERETKDDKFVIIHAKKRAEHWNRIYDQVEKKNYTATLAQQLKHLENSEVIKIWKERNNEMLKAIKEYEDLLDSEKKLVKQKKGKGKKKQ